VRQEAIKAGHAIERIAVAFETGRDGFWLARWLRARGIEAHVIHASSIAMPREHRRAKTDRLDTEALMRAFLGWLRGEARHCRMAALPTLAQEDAKRPSRERESLVAERTRLVNRMKATLVWLGLPNVNIKLRKVAERLGDLRTPEGEPVPPNTLAELRRDLERLAVIRAQITAIEQARLQRLTAAPAQGTHPMVLMLAKILGLGIETADMLVHEVLSRRLRDHRAVARYGGLTGSPDESGSKRREQGLAKAGNARVRRGMLPIGVALAHVPEEQRLDAMVSLAHRRRPRRHPQDHDRGACPQALDRAVALCDGRRSAPRRRAEGGLTMRTAVIPATDKGEV